MNSAYLRDPIDIYTLQTEKTDYGKTRENYVLSYHTRAHIMFDSQSRAVSEGEVYYPNDYTFVVRHYVPVDERCRIKWDNKMWRIISINPNKYYNNKEIRCVEVNK